MKKIVLIEDNKDMRENITEILELSNYKVFAAPNGKKGVELVQLEKPDLIICDIMMPVLDGYGVLHILSKSEQTASIPFIFLTAKAERSELRKGMEMGADDYVTKPFDDIELLNAIESRLRKAEAMKKTAVNSLESIMQNLSGAEAMNALTESDEQLQIKKKETIFKEGAYPRGIYFVKEGKVKTYKKHEIGKEFITGLHSAGEFFGYAALLEGIKYTDTAEALENSIITFIPQELFFDLLYKNVDVAKNFIKLLSGNLAEQEERLMNLAYSSVRKRLADTLINLYEKHSADKNHTLTFSREDLANMAGTAIETTIRTLSDFKTEGLIEIKGTAIQVLKLDRLKAMRN